VTDLLVRIADDKSAMQPLAKIAITHLERASRLEAALLDLDVPLAQLRHLYAQMVGGMVRDATEAARGLLGPSIKRIEQVRATLRGEEGRSPDQVISSANTGDDSTPGDHPAVPVTGRSACDDCCTGKCGGKAEPHMRLHPIPESCADWICDGSGPAHRGRP
jgi:hypothetical protein